MMLREIGGMVVRPQSSRTVVSESPTRVLLLLALVDLDLGLEWTGLECQAEIKSSSNVSQSARLVSLWKVQREGVHPGRSLLQPVKSRVRVRVCVCVVMVVEVVAVVCGE